MFEANSAETKVDSLKHFLCDWAKSCSVTHTQLNQLLNGLNSNLNLNLPVDARTILSTTRTTNIVQMSTTSGESGEFVYLGITENIKTYLSSNTVLSKIEDSKIKLIFNVDGVPLNKSTARQFWPILCKIWISNFNIYPFAVAIFCGKGNPNLQGFFVEFIEEINNLLENGLMFNEKHYYVEILCFTCDAPARAFIKAIKGHNGKYACERCVQKGTYNEGRMLFKQTEAPLRTDASFRKRENPLHHTGVSPLLKITNLNFVATFALDSMHLCFIGVMKKLLRYWYSKTGTKLHVRDRVQISEYLQYTAQFIPSEFNRKSRGLQELEYWKATECRLFALYTGALVLKNVLSKTKYEHFLLFHCALRILLSSEISDYNINCARKMLTAFVEDFPKL